MSQRTGIEWCHHTFNLAWGCQKVSPGCAHCYAETLARRFGHRVWGPPATTPRRTFGPRHWDAPLAWDVAAKADGERRRVFCSSMADVFEDHPTIAAERAKLWPLIRRTPWLDWLLLTKRPERIAATLPPDWGRGYPNAWLGTSIESQEVIGRLDALLRIPATVRFLSCEPLLGPLNLVGRIADLAHYGDLHWVIVGGESGPGARPMPIGWARDLQLQCADFGVAFFLKQLGGHPDKRGGDAARLDGRLHRALPVAAGVAA